MIIKLDHKIEISKMLDYLEFVKKTCPPFMKKDGPWGGWSITSSDGQIYDGWQTGEKLNDPQANTKEKEEIKKLFNSTNFNTPTPLYNDYINELISDLKNKIPNIELSRIRIALLKPHLEESAYWHKDGEADDSKKFRLHIPIITNEQCIFEYKNERQHLPADGSIYLIDVSETHRVTNLSQENRFHLMADVKKV